MITPEKQQAIDYMNASKSMDKTKVDFYKDCKRVSKLSHDMVQRLWEYYSDAFGKGPSGAMNCQNCVRETFYEWEKVVITYINQPENL